MNDAIERFLAALRDRLEAGARQYGNQSFVRPVQAIVDEIGMELIDEVGWTYVLWAVARRKRVGPEGEEGVRAQFVWNLRHRLKLNDRGPVGLAPGATLEACERDLEVLAMDIFAHAELMRQRLHPIARAIEVAEITNPHTNPYRGRRGGTPTDAKPEEQKAETPKLTAKQELLRVCVQMAEALHKAGHGKDDQRTLMVEAGVTPPAKWSDLDEAALAKVKAAFAEQLKMGKETKA